MAAEQVKRGSVGTGGATRPLPVYARLGRMTASITVTELKCASLDAEWRRRWLMGKRPSTRSFAPPGEPSAYGTLFHRIADEFVGWLVESRRKATSIRDAADLWGELYERFAAGRLARIAQRGHVDSALHLSEALKAFSNRVAGLRARTLAFTSWRDVYLANEFVLKDVALRAGGAALQVSGRLDAVRFDPEDAVEVVDYKLTHGNQFKHDLVQLAIYTKLLEQARPGLKFKGTLEYYEPQLHAVAVAKDDLESIFKDLVEPILLELTGGKPPAAPPLRRRVERKPAPAASAESGSPDLSEAIRKCFADFNLRVEVIGRQEAPQLIRYRIRPAPGVKVVSLANRADDLKVALSLPQSPVIEPSQGSVVIDIPKEKPDTVHWSEVIRRPELAGNDNPVAFPVGVGVENHLLVADFADPNMCHGLVAGVAGSGKSEFLKSMVASLIRRSQPNDLKLTIIDPKILTFGSLSSGLPHLSEPVITDANAAIPCLEAAVAEMTARYKTMAKENVENLSLRFKAGKTDLPYRVIVFDEFADLVLSGADAKKEFERLVARIAQMGRAAGIHLMLTTQRPDKNVVTGLIKANLPLKICMRVVNSTNSNIVMDQTGGEKLLGRGDLLCDRGRGIERAQSLYISHEELRKLAC
jgi:S-DNA-T family DNA segregation ATPase FtsK/SpoIIIE